MMSYPLSGIVDMSEHHQPLILPYDESNQQLVSNVHPADWVNPEPTGRYNMVVVGAGTAGLITAVVAASLGAKVALIEKHLMGGDCLNVGCVPSKALIRAAKAWADLKNATEFGLHIPTGVKYDFGTVMARMRKLRARISQNDSARRYTNLGVDVYIGSGRFLGFDTIQVEGSAGDRVLTFARAAVCTGASATIPTTPGLQGVDYLTNDSVFALTQLPSAWESLGQGRSDASWRKPSHGLEAKSI